MDDPPLPTNYITILDLQKQWLDKQHQNSKHLKEEKEINTDKKQSNNSNPNSQFQNPSRFNSNTNPISKNGKFFPNKFNDKNPPKINVVDPKSTVVIKGSKTVYLGHRKGHNKEIEDEGEGKVKTNWKSKGPVRDAKQLHGGNRRFNRREYKVENKVSAIDDQNSLREEVIKEDQTAEIESKFKELSVTGNNWRSKATINIPKKVYRSYRRVEHRGFNFKNHEIEEKSVNESRDELGSEEKGKVDDENRKSMGIKWVHGSYGRVVNREVGRNWGQRGRGYRYERSSLGVGYSHRVGKWGNRNRDMVWVKRSEVNDNDNCLINSG